jgi:hypothetical protein
MTWPSQSASFSGAGPVSHLSFDSDGCFPLPYAIVSSDRFSPSAGNIAYTVELV